MRHTLWIAAVGVTLTGCQYIPGTTAHEKKQAQAFIAASLNDPSSAQFRNLDAHTSKGDHGPFRVVCGEVNGKNGFGAYAGFRRFAYSADAGLAAVDPDVAYSGDDLDTEYQLCRLRKDYVCSSGERIKQARADQRAFNRIWRERCKR